VQVDRVDGGKAERQEEHVGAKLHRLQREKEVGVMKKEKSLNFEVLI
jgi:hypothetical protein